MYAYYDLSNISSILSHSVIIVFLRQLYKYHYNYINAHERIQVTHVMLTNIETIELCGIYFFSSDFEI